jgi:hypothetical protein
MKCPNCGNEQAEGWLSCQRCHIIFARWKPGSAATPVQPPPTPAASGPTRPVSMFAGPPPKQTRFQEAAPALPARRSLSWVVYLVLILPFAVALYLLLNPKGRDVEPGSYRDSLNFFAIRAPEGWLALTKENYDVIMRQYGTQLPAKLTEAVNSKNLAVSFVRLGPSGEFSPSMNVVIFKQAPPPINEKSKQEAAKAIAAGFAAQFADYRQESVKIIEVDSIRSLEILSTSTLPFKFSSAENAVNLTLRSRQVLVPGKDRAYILTFTVRRDAGEDGEAEFQGALDSFRVLKRPPRFSPVLNGAFIGGLIAAMFFLLHGMLLSLGGERIR